jgi:hypothetical protein
LRLAGGCKKGDGGWGGLGGWAAGSEGNKRRLLPRFILVLGLGSPVPPAE